MGIPTRALALGVVSAFAVEAPALTVHTYSSFTADWGPGPGIEKSFEAECGCDMEFVALDDGVSLLTRLRLEGERSRADVVLGLDTNLTAEAQATGLLAPHGVDLSHLRLPVAWDDPTFVPFDYGWFAFVYNRESLPNPPASLDGLVKAPETMKIIVMFPVIELGGGLPEGFSQPLGSEQTLSFGSEEVFEHRKQWIDDWLQAMSR